VNDPSRKLIILSSHVPVGATEPAGLASALEPALRDLPGIWLGWSGQVRISPTELAIDPTLQPPRACFDLLADSRDQLAFAFCNRTLWPLFHGLRTRLRFDDAEWDAYVRANDTYARHALQLADLDATIWVHDYQLLLVGASLRRLGHRGPIGHFLHIPFPVRELFQTLPWGRELLEAVLDFDLIGFHTEQWADKLRRTSHKPGRIRHNQRTTRIGVFPRSVEPASDLDVDLGLDAMPDHDLGERIGDRHFMIAVDPLDQTKGIPERLAAFRCLLERYPEWRRRVVLLQIVVPAHPEHDDRELRQDLERRIGQLNNSLGEADWMPVCYLDRNCDRVSLARLYRAADVAIVTPLRDGMNLVAKEFVAAQHASDPGVLVLSRFAGAAEQMAAAILTNPYHPEGFAQDLHRALGMPQEERRHRHHALAKVLRANGTPASWSDDFLSALRHPPGDDPVTVA